ncbi:MAG: Sec-dependent nitrous-oxide reductase, partial [Bdellovibrionales bacterium]|nr:Sec-dependent nitrous-oxide reductase [Bdellovibrionales bacterium]
MRKNYFQTQAVVSFLFSALLFTGVSVQAESLQTVMKSRGLTEKDILAAAKTYTPSGKRDEYIAFSSGGQSGQLIVYGIPSMRILKYVAVFTPEPWQGYGYDEESKRILESGKIDGKEITFGDTHHPAISETNGSYDGQFLFINDKANPRMAVVDLADFETKQIVVNPIMKSDHGGAFVTPNTEYVIEAAQYAAPFEKGYVPLSQFNEKYRGAVTYWKFDRKAGRIDPKSSWSIELPPYSQDLSDFGKLDSEGWSFTNSFCSERYIGGTGRPPFEAGCSQKDTDYLHMINWRKAEKLVRAGKAKKVNGHDVLPLDVVAKEGVLFLVPEPKSPHGVDVTPDGKFIIISGKLDTHASVFSFAKLMQAVEAKDFAGSDPYGVPILDMQKALHTQPEIGLGPLHTQFDSKKCIAYTSVYVDSQVAKWDYCQGKVLDKLSIHYNIGHLMTMEGDSQDPDGKYLVSLNKLSIDRFNPVGPLQPQNHQLIDISGDKMSLLYDMPLPLGEPHYAVSIKADKLKPHIRYKRGTDSRTGEKSKYSTLPGREKIDRQGNTVHIYATSIRSHITPEIMEVNEGDDVYIHLTNLERAQDQTHGFALYKYNQNLSIEPGKVATAHFKADQAGVYPFYCTEFCSALHLEMQGYLLVKPKGAKGSAEEVSEGQKYTKADYDKQMETIEGTQKVIDSVVAFITERNFKDYPAVVALVEDATDQLNFVNEVKPKVENAVKAED